MQLENTCTNRYIQQKFCSGIRNRDIFTVKTSQSDKSKLPRLEITIHNICFTIKSLELDLEENKSDGIYH